MDRKIIGPELPPHLKASLADEAENSDYISSEFYKEENDQIPQSTPSGSMDLTCEKIVKTGSSTSENSADLDTFGPALPPHLKKNVTTAAPPSEKTNSDEEDVYGPLPPGQAKHSQHLALEERALEMKLDQFKPEVQTVVREEWMTELPDVHSSKIGLGPRQFRSKEGPDLSDRSSWTKTPQDKQKKETKVDLREEAKLKELTKRDQEQEKVAKRHKKKNAESLLEIHQKKMKLQEKSSSSTERKPFNRETDLQVNRFDDAQKAAVLKKAQLLDTRFSSGQSKFL